MTNFKNRMTKEFQMTNGETDANAVAAILSIELRHSLVIRISSLDIS
jgi:hypothetical protein